jgi:hypothetical protein
VSSSEPRRPLDVDAWLNLLPNAFSRGITRGVASGLVIATALTIGLGLTVAGGQLLSPFWFGPYPLVFAAVTTTIVPIAMGSGRRAAYEVFSWLGRWEINRFRVQAGSSVPMTPDAVVAWLREHPTPAFGGYARIEMVAWTGTIAQARDELSSFPPPTDLDDAAERVGLELWLDLLERGAYDPAPLQHAIARLSQGPGRSRAEANLALLETRVRLADGRADWWRPLAEVRRGLGWAPSLVVLRDTLSRIFVLGVIAALLLSGTLALVMAIF